MIWDGAGFHVSGQLKVPANVTLIQLPPYSPELNPIENLWHYLKSHFWSNRAYANYDELEQAAVHAWQKVVLDAELMKTVCNAPYAKALLQERTRIRRYFRMPAGIQTPRFRANYVKSGRRGSNSRHPAWEASALPTELHPHIIP